MINNHDRVALFHTPIAHLLREGALARKVTQRLTSLAPSKTPRCFAQSRIHVGSSDIFTPASPCKAKLLYAAQGAK